LHRQDLVAQGEAEAVIVVTKPHTKPEVDEIKTAATRDTAQV
jgi:hypothetical protein